MNRHTPIKVISVIVSVVMLISMIPATVFAAIPNWEQSNSAFDGTSFGTNGYYNVISQKDYTLVPGAATETEMVINNSAGNRRQVMHILECDPSNPDISIVPGYYNIDKDITDVNNWAAAGMTDMAAKYEQELGYNVVCGMNTALAYDNNAPYSYLVYNGQVLVDAKGGVNNFHSGTCKTMLCVYKNDDGTCYCELRTHSQGLRGDEWQAIGANFDMVVKDGQLVAKTEERTTSAAARSMIGVKEDGTLVIVMNDGRGANNSVGFCTYELGESMLALGCKWAFNCDGGGSSGFVSKRAGETEITMRSVPCDGAERPTLNGIFVVSNVGPTGELNNVNVNSDYDYFAPGTSYTFEMDAIDTHGYAMDMPADVSCALSDASFGTVSGSTFTSNGTVGDVDFQVLSGGKVVGSRTIHVANPTSLSLSSTSTTLPYSTAEKVRTINLPMVATIGESNVYTSGAYDISISPANGGTVDGLKFTATDDTSVAKATVSINYIPTNTSFTYTVNYGKGSEVLWNFENGDISDWKGTDDADQFMRDNGAAVSTSGSFSTPFRTLFSGGQISWSNKTYTKLSSIADGGQAHGGDKALAVTFDMKNVEFNSWVYSIIYNTQGNIVLRDVANGNTATAFGCWVYVPKGFYTAKNNGAQALQLTVQRGTSSTAALSGTQLNMQYNGKNINALKESDIPENRWIYVKADLTGANFVKLVDPLNDVYRSPSIMRMYVKPSEAQEMTYYFDDFTLDYSSAVDDREPPVISNPTYCTSDTNFALDNPTLTTNVVSFDANVADYAAANAEGLDYSSAKIYVDGLAQSNVKASGNTMGVSNVVLSNGVHSVKFEIADKLGNSTTLTKQITINADGAKSAVRLSGHNDKNNTIEAGSVYYVDVVADAIEEINSVTTTVELQSAHEWELDNMIVAKGFEASYELNSIKDNIATITITKTGASDLTGEQTLVSLPARVWSYDEDTLVGGDSSNAPVKMTSAARYATTYGEPVLLMEANVLYGEVGYTDKTTGTYSGSISEATAVTGNKLAPWHEHTATAVEDKAASCTEEGYTGRTYCDECGSVVDWGTKLPAKGHSYELVNGEFICSECEDKFDYSNKTGLFSVSGKYYYAIAGNLLNGWQNIDNEWYFFNPSTYTTQPTYSNGIVTFKFDETGKLKSGEWYNDGTGTKYYYGPDYYRCGAGNPYANVAWETIGSDTYGFDRQGYRHEGIRLIVNSNNPGKLYEFDNNGVLIGEYTTDYTGIFHTNGQVVYLENGTPVAAGLIKVGDDFYYINSGYVAVTGRYDVTRPNGLMPSGTYDFGPDGKMILLNGPQDDGYFYINGTRQSCYQLIQYNGNYYFINDGHKYAKNTRLYLNSNFVAGSGLSAGYYEFDSEGKIILRNGPQEDGTFYINGSQKMAYQLIEYQGDYYFINDGNKYAKNARIYLSQQFVEGTDFVPAYYDFGADGKLIIKNGPLEDGYFYRNGVRLSAYQLVEYNGDYYFINDAHKYAKNARIYLSQQFVDGTDFVPAYYDFGADGKLIVKNGPMDDGYFYLNGVRQSAYQLVEYEGSWYFINDGHKLAKSQRIYLSQQFVDGTPFSVGYYDFDAEGKLVVKNGPWEDGYFYLNSVRQNAYQLIEYNGKYYFIDDGNKYAKNKRVYISAPFIGDLPIDVGYYDFGADGSIQNLIYYKNAQGEVVPDLGLIYENGNYYFVRSTGQLAVGNYKINENKTNDFLKGDKTFYFDENGVMTLPDYYIKGIRDGRDVGVFMAERNGGVTGYGGKAIKTGMILRGGEIDGAINPYTNQPDTEYVKQHAIDVLKNTYGVKTDIDLRNETQVALSKTGLTNPLGDDVTHNYYDMCLYDDILTDTGKQRVKAVFDDLSNAENAPVYIHCTWGLDRTGIICFLLEGVLGIDERSCIVEYCTTKGSDQPAIDKVRNAIKNNYSGADFTEKVENYLKSCGITDAQIQSLRDTFLEG